MAGNFGGATEAGNKSTGLVVYGYRTLPASECDVRAAVPFTVEVVMRKRLVTIGAACVLALSGIAAVSAQRGGPGAGRPEGAPPQGAQAPDGERRGGPGGPAQRGGPGIAGPRSMFGPGIDLTDAQLEKLTAIMRTARDQSAPLRDELEFTRRTLHRESFADKRDASKIALLSSKVVDLEKQLLDLNVKSQASIADLLTPEQRSSVRASGAAFGAMGPGGPGRMVGGGRGGRQGGGREGRGNRPGPQGRPAPVPAPQG
jgi:Spy/CpxP family protein refolding chaperone